MLGTLTETQQGILREIWRRRRAAGATLRQIATTSRLAPPSALAQVRKLVASGLVERRGGRPDGPTYHPRPYFEAGVMDPVTGLVDSWRVNEVPDWRFPLVARVRDRPARDSLTRFLAHASERGLLQPRASVGGGRGAPGITIIAYGSCVDGTARPGSDVDVVGILGPRAGTARKFRDLVAEVNLSVERKIDARFLSVREFESLPPPVRMDLRAGKTVYRSSNAGAFVEALP